MPIKSIPMNRQIERSRTGTASERTFKVRFLPLDVTVDARESQSLLEVCDTYRIPLEHRCGGNCACSSCRIIVHRGLDRLSAQGEDELDQLRDLEDLPLHSRLGCQARVQGDVEVEIPV